MHVVKSAADLSLRPSSKYMIFGGSFLLSEPQFSHLSDDDDNRC